MPEQSKDRVCFEDPYCKGSSLCGEFVFGRRTQPSGTVSCLRCIAFSNDVKLYKKHFNIKAPKQILFKDLKCLY